MNNFSCILHILQKITSGKKTTKLNEISTQSETVECQGPIKLYDKAKRERSP